MTRCLVNRTRSHYYCGFYEHIVSNVR